MSLGVEPDGGGDADADGAQPDAEPPSSSGGRGGAPQAQEAGPDRREASAPSGGTASDAGSGGNPASMDGGDPREAATDGGADAPVSLENPLCTRLVLPAELAFDVTRDYERRVFGDCRVTQVTDLYLRIDKRHTFLNELLAWSLWLWDCTPAAPNTTGPFPLVYADAVLTTADVRLLIEHYLGAADAALELGPVERRFLRARLESVAESAGPRQSEEFTEPRCNDAGIGPVVDAATDAWVDGRSAYAEDGGVRMDASFDASTDADGKAGAVDGAVTAEGAPDGSSRPDVTASADG